MSTKTAMKKKFQDKDNHDTPAKKAQKIKVKGFMAPINIELFGCF